MADNAIFQTSNELEKANLSYAFATYHNYTKNVATAAYDAGVVCKKFLNSIKLDQSIRNIIPDITHRQRFGFCGFAEKAIGTYPKLCWEFVPDTAESITFSDDFSTDFGTPDYDTSKWQTYNGSPTVAIVSGALRITASTSMGLRSVSNFNMLNKAIGMKVPVLASNANVANGFLISSADGLGTYWGMDEYNGNLRCVSENSLVHAPAYNAVNQLYKRISFTATQAIFQTSTDGITWTTLHTATSNAAKTALYIYLRPYFAASNTVEYDDIKLVTPAASKKFQVVENGTVVFTSAQTPTNDDELRIQIVYEAPNYKVKYWWRNDSGSGENLEYTSLLSSATIQGYFPLLGKAEAYDDATVLRNIQLELNDTGSFEELSYNSSSNVGNANFQLFLDDGYPDPADVNSTDVWMLDFPRPVSAEGIVADSYIAVDSTILGLGIISPGVTSGGIVEFDVKINGVSILDDPLEVNFATPEPEIDVEIEVEENDLLEVECLSTNRTLARPTMLRVRVEETGA
jgi:hypothetical protein